MPKKRNVPKKKSSRRGPAKLPAGKTFTVTDITRHEVARLLNLAIEGNKARLERFAPGDPRLTDKVCEAFAWSICDGLTDSEDTEDEVKRDVASDVLDEFLDAEDS